MPHLLGFLLGFLSFESEQSHSPQLDRFPPETNIFITARFPRDVSKAIRTMYQRKVDVDMLKAVKSVLADVSSVSPSSEQRANAQNVSQHTLYGLQHIHINLTLIH